MIDVLLSRLDKVRPNGSGKHMACCPSHDDRSPSLSITEKDSGQILIHCFAGCSPAEIMDSVDMSMGDLFPDENNGEHKTQKNEKLLEKERLVLAIAEHDRAEGVRLSGADLERERQAFMYLKGEGEHV